jgi:hypothetical protein
VVSAEAVLGYGATRDRGTAALRSPKNRLERRTRGNAVPLTPMVWLAIILTVLAIAAIIFAR